MGRDRNEDKPIYAGGWAKVMKNRIYNSLWAHAIVEELVRLGVTYFIVSPGSRSTPLVAAIARNEKAKCKIVYDERGAGYRAVGYARATGKPAAVVTTSGSAVSNLLPAVTEASRGCVPMIVLTADRPYELVRNGSNQTMEQGGIFGEFSRYSYELECPKKKHPVQHVIWAVDEAYTAATDEHRGPVHINCRYAEPLEPVGVVDYSGLDEGVQRWRAGDKPLLYMYEKPKLRKKKLSDLAKKINGTSRGMVLVGELWSAGECEAVKGLIARLGWPVYADITSQLRLSVDGAGVYRYFDQELLSDEFNEKARPDFVLHIGGRITSKRVPQFFGENRPEDYVVLKNTPDRYDPSGATKELICTDVEEACTLLAGLVEKKRRTGFGVFYDLMSSQAGGVIEEMVDDCSLLSEAFIARQLSKMIGDDSSLFLSSSMPIRDMDLYAVGGRGNVKTASNRGLSGIDGVVSSAMGFAEGSESETTLLIGDLAFIHDVNALSGLRHMEQPLVIVVVNNGGGGIFHFLPISEYESIFEEYFAAGHEFSFDGAAKTFNVDYYKAVDKAGFVEAYRTAVSNGGAAIIECATDRVANLKMRRAMKAKILEAVVSG